MWPLTSMKFANAKNIHQQCVALANSVMPLSARQLFQNHVITFEQNKGIVLLLNLDETWSLLMSHEDVCVVCSRLWVLCKFRF